jgi:hypothetical protein
MTVPLRSSARRKWRIWLLIAVGTGLRAQVTETPHTVAPGSFLLEVDAITVGVNRDRTESNNYTALGLASAILSTGITPDLDVQFGQQFFLRQTYQFRGARSSSSGRGDTTIRLKLTYWRGPNGSAAAVLPYVKLPTNTGGVGNNHLEGGLIFPWALSLGSGTTIGAMGEWDIRRDAANASYLSRWFASAYVHQRLLGSLGAYAESTLAVSSLGFSSFVGSVGGGVLWDTSHSLQFDYSVSRGLGNRATDWLNVLRVNWRF